jgi:NAD(P)-dependent dehydrogenase (short-subunit alcohol dehydrogenase family)
VKPLRFDDKVVLITGAGRGLGRAYAELLARRGAIVVLNDLPPTRDRADDVSSAVDAIRDAGGRAEAAYGDVSDEAAARTVAETALGRHGRVDVFIHNAGTASGSLDHHLNLHVFGAMWISRAVWPGMVERRYGRILLTTSGVGLFGVGARGHAEDVEPTSFGEGWLYGVAKMGEVGLTRHLAVRGRTANVLTNAISPIAYTSAAREATAFVDDSPRMTWIREKCTPERVAPVAAYLVHESCSLNGEIIRAAGGRVSRVFIAETPGIVSPDLDLDVVRDRFAAIRDEADYRIPGESKTFSTT